MTELFITDTIIEDYKRNLKLEEKSANTIEKYIRDVKAFREYAKNQSIIKELVIEYKEKLISDEYAVRSINSIIASLNSFFSCIMDMERNSLWPTATITQSAFGILSHATRSTPYSCFATVTSAQASVTTG